MYTESIFEVSKAENGFIVEVKVPISHKSGKDKAPMGIRCCADAKYVCKDSTELLTTIKGILPKLDVAYSSEDAFEKAFKAATEEDD